MLTEHPGLGPVALVADHVGNVLLEPAARVHHHDLEPTADAEHWQVAVQGPVEKC